MARRLLIKAIRPGNFEAILGSLKSREFLVQPESLACPLWECLIRLIGYLYEDD